MVYMCSENAANILASAKVSTLFDKGPQPSLCTGLWVAHIIIAVSGVPKLNYCAMVTANL